MELTFWIKIPTPDWLVTLLLSIVKLNAWEFDKIPAPEIVEILLFLITIFEPHTYSRTKKFYKEIAQELNKSDKAYILDIYKSREKKEDYKGITSNLIVKNLKNGEHLKKEEYKKLTKYKNAVILFMSPNDLTELEQKYIKEYNLTKK